MSEYIKAADALTMLKVLRETAKDTETLKAVLTFENQILGRIAKVREVAVSAVVSDLGGDCNRGGGGRVADVAVVDLQRDGSRDDSAGGVGGCIDVVSPLKPCRRCKTAEYVTAVQYGVNHAFECVQCGRRAKYKPTRFEAVKEWKRLNTL